MPEKLAKLLGVIPFMMMVKNPEGENHITVNWTRILEAIIIAAVTGFVASYVSVAKLEVRFDMLSDQVKITQQQLFDHMNENRPSRR